MNQREKSPAGGSRRYDSPLRREQARSTERRILDVAERLMLDRGYASTSISAIAADAGVSPQTIYKTFGTKAALTKRLYDVRLVGDDEPVPLAQRRPFRAMATELDPRRILASYAEVGRAIAERLVPIYAVVLAGAQAGDPELRELVAATEQERLTGTGGLVARLAELGALRQELTVERARDLLWVMTAPELYRRLVVERGWSPADYEAWTSRATADALLRPQEVGPQ